MTQVQREREKPPSSIGKDCTLPLTETQKEMWLAARISDAALRACNNTLLVHLRGDLKCHALLQCLQELVDRHDALRTSFSLSEPEQCVAAAVTLEMPIVDLTQKTEPEQEVELVAAVQSQSTQAFDLTQAPLLSVCLARLSESYSVLVLTSNHLVADSWSLGLLLDELKVLYASRVQGVTARLAPALQFREYVQLLDAPDQREARSAAEAYWLQQFDDIPALIDLPNDFSRPATRTYSAGQERRWLGPDLWQMIRRASTRQGCTPLTYLLAVFKVLVSRVTGQQDLVVAIPAAGQTAAWLQQRNGNGALVGHCVNFLPVRSNCERDLTFTNYLKTLDNIVLDSYKYQNFTYGRLLTRMSLPRDPSRAPLVSVVFSLDRAAATGFSLYGLETEVREVPRRGTLFDLELNVIDRDKDLQLVCTFNSHLFAPTTIQRWLSHYQTLVADALANPDKPLWELALLTREEERQILVEWNQTKIEHSADWDLASLFEAQVERTPEAVAVVHEGQQVTYRELNRRANQLAHYLRKMGIGPEVLAGICVDRSVEMIVGLLGILKAGGAYVPLDPAYPRERLDFMLKDARVGAVLTTASLLSGLPELQARVVCLDTERDPISRESERNLVLEGTPENLAYVIYTSGSTGAPKGVEVSQAALVNFLTSMKCEPGMKPEDVLLAVTTLSFDIAGLEMFLPLIVGARVVVASRETAMDGVRLMELLESSGTTVMQATPATWRLLLETGWKGNRELKVLCGGEALPRELARDLLKRSQSLWNLYGPTETTVWSTVGEVRLSDQNITIGRPIANTQVYLLDKRSQPVPVGVPGELYIGGDGVARGYRRREELTAERFVTNPFQVGTRLYRTGDLARYLSDGRIECLGRIDRQVKLRGYRIETEEIETVLRQHPAVRQAVVMIRENVSGDQRLVAYLILRSKGSESTREIRGFLAEKLPEYMVPAFLIPLDTLPLTNNGKIDYRALPAVSGIETEVQENYVGARDEVERKLIRIWEELLGVRPIGVKDNFFDLGGHSLLATRLIARIEKSLGNVSLSNLFQSPTIESLARELRQKKKANEDSSLVLFRNGGSRPPLFVHGGSFELSRHLGDDQPCYGIRPHGQDGRKAPATVEDMAADYLKQIRGVQPQGPYLIGGFSFGGLVAYEMAQQLRQSGQEVGLLVLIDPSPPYSSTSQFPSNGSLARGNSTLNRHLTALRQGDLRLLVDALRSRGQWMANALKRRVCGAHLKFGRRIPSSLRMFYFFEVSEEATRNYAPTPYPGRTVLLSSQPNTVGLWRNLVAGTLEVHQLQGDHLDAIKGPKVELWAKPLKSSLSKAL